MTQTFLFVMVMLLAQARGFADGGTVQMRKEAGPFLITVFTSPAPLSAGPADISVLLQNLDGLAPVLDARVSVLLRREASSTEIKAHATREQAQNKLLYAALVTLPESGKWRLSVTTLHNALRTEIGGEIGVTQSHVMAGSYWGYIALPPVIIAVFVIREWLIRRKPTLRANQCKII
jgi:hypothetical protein